jgi:arylsulfatase A-like enzyme
MNGGGLPTRRYEKNCFERASLHTIKAHMNSIRFNRFGRAFIAAMLIVVAFEFLPDARAFLGGDVAQPNGETWNSTNSAPRAIPRRASIILIVADGLGYGDLSCYGQTKFQTPNLDKLAAEGIQFTNYSTYDGNSPSHSSLLVGKNLSHLKQSFDADILIAANSMSIAEILKNSGYHTGLVGEWGLGDENSAGAPWRKGFDEFAGYLNSSDAENFYADYMFRYAPKAIFNETNGQMEDYIGREMIYTNTAGQKGQYIPDLFTHAALQFIKNNQPDLANHYQPFFLLLNYPVPLTGMPVPTDAPFSGEAWPQAEKNQAAIISRLDGYVGELTEQLLKVGMTNNAVIFFTSASVAKKAAGIDPEFFHSNLSTNDLRVSMIVHWPGRIPPGQVSGFKWSPQDFLPTAAQIGFANSPTNLDGISVLPFLSKKFEGKTSDLPGQRDF